MQRVRVEVGELAAKVKANRDKHAEAVRAAEEQYRTEAINRLQDMLEKASSGGEIELYLGLTQPADYTSEYDRVLLMLEMSTDAEIELTATEFSQYVMDRWEWSKMFEQTTMGYANKVARR